MRPLVSKTQIMDNALKDTWGDRSWWGMFVVLHKLKIIRVELR